jgi:AcrR family transcriptional regulator
MFLTPAPGSATFEREITLSSHRNTNRMRGRVARRYLARRLEILRAAGKQFRSAGFAETGMRDIAAAADLSPANLYNYFLGKHELLFFCQDLTLDRLLATLRKALRLRATAAERLRVVIVSHMCCVLDEVEGSAAHLLTSALPPRLNHALVAKRDRYEAGVRQLISRGARNGEFAPCDPALAARAIFGALNWTVQWFNPGGPLTATNIADGFADYLIRGLLAKPDSLKRSATVREHHQARRKLRPPDVRPRASAARLSER